MNTQNTLRSELQTWLELVARVASNIPFYKEITWDDIETVGCENLQVPDYITQSGESVPFIDVMNDAIVIDQSMHEPLYELALHIIQKYKGTKLY